MDYLDQVIAIIDRYDSLGTRVLDNGTRLIGRAPHVAPEAWLQAVFVRLTEPDLNALTLALGRPIPPTFAAFLRRCNGLSLFSDSLAIFGFRTDYARTGDSVWQPFSLVTPNVPERPRHAKPSFLFVGSYSFDGSLVYVDAADGKAYRCARRSASR